MWTTVTAALDASPSPRRESSVVPSIGARWEGRRFIHTDDRFRAQPSQLVNPVFKIEVDALAAV